MEYKIGDKLEVATKMLTMEIPSETKVMTLTGIYGATVDRLYYTFNGNSYIHYPPNRILRKVEGL